MSNVIIHGPAISSYVRTARLVCLEKGIEHERQPVEFGSEALAKLHPYKKVPVLTHGDVHLWETQAIARYLDESFDGPTLTPSSAAERGEMEQWISIVNCYLYPDAIKNYVLQYIFAKADGPDRSVIDVSVPLVKRHCELLDTNLEGKAWLLGEALSLADLFVFPIIGGVSMFPEGKEILGECKNLSRALAAMADRPSWPVTAPQG